MSALDAVIRMRALEAEEKKMQQQNVANVFGAFQKARETSMLIDLEKQKIDVSLAKSGLRMGEGGIETAPDLLDQVEGKKDVVFASPKGLKTVGTVAKDTQVFKDPTTTIAGAEGLSSEQQVKALALARRLYGVRGAKLGAPAIFAEMKTGKSIDQIEDELRYAGQSQQFGGAVRGAAQNLLIGESFEKSQNAMDFIDDQLTRGNTEGVRSSIKRLTLDQAGVDERRTAIGKERTIKLLGEIQGNLNQLEEMGVDTNIFTGTAEQIAAKVGTVVNPEARKIATKISAAVQNYRRSMTGVQFGLPENEEYKVMFPSIGRTANFNSANISALQEVMSGDLDNFYGAYMGRENYKELFKDENSFASEEEALSANLPSGTEVVINGRRAVIE